MKSQKILIPFVVILVVVTVGGGYFLWQTKSHKGAQEAKHEHGKEEYTCPMHPFIIKDKPGSCPICGMTLVKKTESAEPSAKEAASLEQVALSPSQQVMANVATVKVNRVPLAKEITAVGIVQYDQSRQGKVTAWVAGRIDRLHVNTVGAYVAKGKPVAEVYSPDLVAAQEEYLLALKSRAQLKDSPIQAISQGGDGLVSSARQRLKLMGVRDEQLASLEKAGQPNIRLSIYTPLSGIVIDKLVLEGQYVNVGDPLFTVADLSTIWVEVEVYEADFPTIRLGQRVDITSQSYPGRTFTGRVAFVYPFLDPKTRTVKVRVELSNPGLKLKPDMFVNAVIKVPLGESLAVPVTAVMDTGKRQVAWIEIKPGVFEPRDVKVGERVGDQVQILSGLLRGDKVAASGGYLIDSEAQLRGGGGSGSHAGHEGMKMEEQKAAPPSGHEGHGTPQAPGKKNDMDMNDMKM